jgi:hypothetical protein
MVFIHMLKVTSLVCVTPVMLVPCLLDCKPGKTPNRGQVFPYLSLCKENNGAPVSANMRGWTRTRYSDSLRSVNSFSQHIPHYDVLVYCSVRQSSLDLFGNVQTDPLPQNLKSSLFCLPLLLLVSLLYTVKYTSSRTKLDGVADSTKRNVILCLSLAINVWKQAPR